jgi:hypothetical protein
LYLLDLSVRHWGYRVVSIGEFPCVDFGTIMVMIRSARIRAQRTNHHENHTPSRHPGRFLSPLFISVQIGAYHAHDAHDDYDYDYDYDGFERSADNGWRSSGVLPLWALPEVTSFREVWS